LSESSLRQIIDQLRDQLTKAFMDHNNLQSEEVLEASQKLDGYIVRLQKLLLQQRQTKSDPGREMSKTSA